MDRHPTQFQELTASLRDVAGRVDRLERSQQTSAIPSGSFRDGLRLIREDLARLIRHIEGLAEAARDVEALRASRPPADGPPAA